MLTYPGFQNIMVMVQAVFDFVSVELGRKLKSTMLLKKVCERAKRFVEIPDSTQYAIADGTYRLLFGQTTGAQEAPQRSSAQMLSAFVLRE